MTYNPQESLDLIRLAEKSGKILMVGNIMLYNKAFNYIKDHLSDIGNIRYINSLRLNLGPIRGDCNAMYDLATHDIYMINHLLESRPISVFASGKSYVKKGIEDVVSMILNYPNNIQANITSSWIDPNKKRVMTIVGDKKMIELDDVATNKVIIYDKGASYQPKTDGFGEFQLAVRDGDILIPKIAGNEPLKDECKDFLDSIKTGKQPVASGTTGYETVVILDAGKKSMDRNELMRIEYINTQSI
jgi:predicted dehydrogenase